MYCNCNNNHNYLSNNSTNYNMLNVLIYCMVTVSILRIFYLGFALVHFPSRFVNKLLEEEGLCTLFPL